jgi:hypothetical protein
MSILTRQNSHFAGQMRFPMVVLKPPFNSAGQKAAAETP